MNTHTRPDRRLPTLAGDSGMTLVELMVAITVMMIILAGVAAGANSGLRLARGNSNRIVAANVADQRISDVRAMDFTAIPQTITTGTTTQGAVDYTWTQQAEMVFLNAAQSTCDAPAAAFGGTQPAYLRVIVEVSWPRMEGIDPVRSETLIDPPIADYSDPYRGHLAVKVTDRDGGPVAGMTVRLSNADAATPATNTFKTTNTEGCAFFDNLEVIPGETTGNYHVWLDETGWVDRASGLSDTSAQVPQPVSTIVSAELRKEEFNYDRAAFLDVTLAGEFGGEPADDLPVTITNDNYNGGNGPVVFDTTGILAAEALHPFPAGFSLWAGRCVDSDPGAADRTRLATDPDTTTTGAVAMATLDVTVLEENDPGEPVGGRKIEVDDSCGNTYTFNGAPTDGSGFTRLALPYGDWTVRVDGESPYFGSWPTIQLTAANGGPHALQVAIDD